jgi:NTE family protein
MSARRRKVALVIGAGAIRCAASLGVQQVLRREGIELDLAVGCSGGAIYAAFAALGVSPEDAQDLTRRIWQPRLTRRRNRRAALQVLFPRFFPFDERFGLLDDRPILAALEEGFGDRTFADARVPLSLVATDYHSGEKVVLTSGRLVDAIRASIAIPFAFPAWKVGDRYLLDGSQSDPLPVDVAMRAGASVILAVGFPGPTRARVRDVTRYAAQITTIMGNHLLEATHGFHALAHHDEVLPLMPELPERIGAFDTTKVALLVGEGARAMEERLPYLCRLLEAHAPARAG